MKRKVPKKNISKHILDILPPFKKEEKKIEDKKQNLNLIYYSINSQSNLNNFSQKYNKNNKIKNLIFFISLLLIFIGIFYIKNFINISLPKVSVDKSIQDFYSNQKQILGNQNNNKFDSVIDQFKSLIFFIGENIGYSQEFFKNINSLIVNYNYISNNWFNFFYSDYDSKYLRQSFINISNSIKFFKDNLNKFKLEDLNTENDIFLIRSEINRLSNFLDNFIAFMDQDKEHRFLLLFSNTSEMRPGGGFIGSYADISIINWKVNKINILDINQPDSEFKEKIIPPKPLQNVLIGWKAADANWFLDFDRSASKIINFLELSDFYKKENIKFEGAILITPQVIQDILNLTGSIEINPQLILNQNNFLIEIQKNIQQKRKDKDLEPKKILDLLFNKILERFSNLNYEDKNKIINYLYNWAKNKDIVFYFKDKNFQSFFDAYNLTGLSTVLDSNFFGDYLAVVDANPGSGKSDIFIKKIVNIKIQIFNNGILNNELEIKRINNVKSNYDWWYKLHNIDFIQIFTPSGTQILNAKGGIDRKIYPRINYQKNNFVFDNDLNYEKTEKVIDLFPQIKQYNFNDKNIFASWLITEIGETSSLKLEYSRNLFKMPQNGDEFNFVLDHQIGDRGEYNIEINAPIGFKFKENNSSVFKYNIKNSADNKIINLTLVEDI